MNRLTYILIIGLLGPILYNLTIEKRKFKGDLYFKLISIGSYYNAVSVSVERFDRTLDSLLKVDKHKLSKNNLEGVKVYGGLKKYGLIYKPFFNLKIDSATSFIVFASEPEFNKVKDVKLDDLIKDNKKVQV